MSARHALFPGTFDPLTLGHADVLRRALALWERVTVAVAAGGKQTLLSLADRLEMVRRVVAATGQGDRCRVVPLRGLLVDLRRELGADVVVRGLRSVADLEHEQSMAAANRRLDPDYEIVCLFARPDLGMISSTLVRDIIRCGGPLAAVVPPEVAAFLDGRIAGNGDHTGAGDGG